MIKCTIVAVAVILLLSSDTRPADIVITNDRGGTVTTYAYWFRGIAARRDRVVIDGYCASSCTLALAIPTTCATPRSVFGFHAAYDSFFGVNIGIDAELTRYFMSQYPKRIRDWLNARGGLTPGLKYLKGAELAALVKRC